MYRNRFRDDVKNPHMHLQMSPLFQNGFNYDIDDGINYKFKSNNVQWKCKTPAAAAAAAPYKWLQCNAIHIMPEQFSE